MKCPHCLVDFHPTVKKMSLGEDATSKLYITQNTCSACGKFILQLEEFVPITGKRDSYNHGFSFMFYPKTTSRAQLSPHVPKELATDYKEACITLVDSPKASSALSRRCLQHLLREKTGVKHSNLANEIQEALDSGQLPSHLSESLDAIRNIGNFAAHPIKSESTGEIVDVEPGEAEWNLDVLESLFDFYFVQPAIIKGKRDALNKKLQDAKKPPMK